MKKEIITLAHGSGGKAYHQLVEQIFLPAFANTYLTELQDSAVCPLYGEKLALTTDSFVVKPRFFPGGDIGRLSVCGTVNDIAMSGATPHYLTLAMIIEAGFELAELRRICVSIAQAAEEAGVSIVTGDTKVVEKRSVDGIYINTAGCGFFAPGVRPLVGRVEAGDCILVSGTLAAHGMAVLAARENLDFSPAIRSDVAPLNGLIGKLLASVPDVHALRDPTRGGAAMTLNEWVVAGKTDIVIKEKDVPVDSSAAAACRILGMEPLAVANEGKFLAAVPEGQAEVALAALKSHVLGRDAAIIGRVIPGQGRLVVETAYGGRRIVAMPEGEQLPRIC
ncbi:MAG: hydrogenase expression/formation protein HypE [Clostridiales bacterium]